MKKHKLLFLGAALAAMPFAASAATIAYDENFPDKKYTRTDNARALKWFTLTNDEGSIKTFEVNQNRYTTRNSNMIFYMDAPFVASPGDVIRFSGIEGDYFYAMHAFLFIDYNGDGNFNSSLNTFNNTDYTTNLSGNNLTSFNNLLSPSATGELVTFSAFNIGSTFVNSKGKSAASGATITATPANSNSNADNSIPSFTLPTNLASGTYEALLKIDWSNIDPYGAGDIGGNGGCFVRFQINVVKERRIHIKSADTKLGTVAFQGEDSSVDEKTFNAGQTAVVVATPNDESYTFLNWTKGEGDDAEVVSTDATYTVDIADEEFTLVAHFVDSYKIPFDENNYKGKTYNDNRYLKSFTLQNVDGNSLPAVKYNVNQDEYSPRKVYKDLTDAEEVFVTSPGAKVSFKEVEFSTGYNWIHGYLYIDLNNDGGFNSLLNVYPTDENGNDKTGLPAKFEALKVPAARKGELYGDLMSFSKYNFGTDDGTNANWLSSLGKRPDDVGGNGTNTGSGVPNADAMPAFTIPANLQPGKYLALFKTDYSDLSQHADQPYGNNTIEGVKGSATLFYIDVKEVPSLEWPTESAVFTVAANYSDAAHVTLHYSTDKIDPNNHIIQVYAVPHTDGAASAPAYRTMARAAAGETDEHSDCIYPDNFNNVGADGTLVFTIPNNTSNPTLHFAPTKDGYPQGSSPAYDVTVKAFDTEGNELNKNATQTISFDVNGDTSGIVDIEEAATAAPRYYNLQGIEVAQPTSAGVYIVRQGNAVSKVYVK